MFRSEEIVIGNRLFYGPDEDAAAAAAAKAAEDEAIAAAAAKAAAADDDNDPLKKLKFSPEQQKFFNETVAKEKKRLQQQNEKTIEELKKLQQQQGVSEKQKSDLQNRINELQQQFMSKEEIAKQEREKQEREHQGVLQSTKQERDQWKERFQNSTITRAIQDAAIEADAYSPIQIVDMLERRTRLVEEVDEDNKPTGRFVPRVKVEEVQEDKTVVLDLTVKEALQKMKNTPERFGNLFKSGVAGGLGRAGSADTGSGRKKDPGKLTMAEYLEQRKKDPNLKFAEKQ